MQDEYYVVRNVLVFLAKVHQLVFQSIKLATDCLLTIRPYMHWHFKLMIVVLLAEGHHFGVLYCNLITIKMYYIVIVWWADIV